MRPPPARCIAGMTAWHINISPRRLIPISRSIPSSVITSMRSLTMTPATLASTSMRPIEASASCMSASALALFDTSVEMNTPRRPVSFCIASTASAPQSSRMSATTMSYPSRASPRAEARPSPQGRAAPVTIATRSAMCCLRRREKRATG